MARPERQGLSGIAAITFRRLAGLCLAALVASPLVFRPGDVPPDYAPWVPLDPVVEPNFVTPLKLIRAGRSQALCRAALDRGGAVAPALSDRVLSEQCHLRDAVRAHRLSRAGLTPEAMRCAIALRLLMWERHALQPAAQRLLGSPVAAIEHYGAYSCRPVRTHRGPSRRMSEHASANAFDIAGFMLADGRRVTLRADWPGAGAEADFLREVRDGLCRFFRVVLSPDYNALHADHFHVDQGRFMACH